MRPLEKLIMAKELLLEAEIQLINESGKCPYELGFTLRKIEEAIEQVQKMEEPDSAE